jgi:hypothetical protein
MRRMLGVLKADEGQRLPQPTLAQLPELVSGTAELEVTGEPRPVPPDTEIAVDRIVQEALTNTVKHAATAGSAAYRLRICNESPTTGSGRTTDPHSWLARLRRSPRPPHRRHPHFLPHAALMPRLTHSRQDGLSQQ